MKLEWNFFHSKVARRIFYLFILSALIPVVFLAIFQWFQMSQQLNQNSQQQVRQRVKTIGMDLIGRLYHLENQIKLLGDALNTFSTEETINQSENIVRLASDFKALTLMKNGEDPEVLKGILIALSTRPSMPVGQISVSVSPPESGKKTSRIIFIHRFNPDSYLLGRVKNIWSFDIQTNALFWVIGPENKLIYRNNALPLPSKLTMYKKKGDSDVFPWQWNNQSYQVGYWSLFLKQRLKSDDWTVVLAEPQASVLVEAKSLYTIFLPTIIFAFLLSMLLSQAQIRRLLIPLEKLSKATRRLAQNDFKTPVNIHSNDEFEALGMAFNTMAKRLNHQFKTLSILSLLDQSIVSNKNGESVLKLIFERLKEAVDYDVLVLGILKTDNSDAIDLRIDNRANDKVETVEALISGKDSHVLKYNQQLILDLSKDELPGFLKHLDNQQLNFLLLFPILHRGRMTALISLGFKNKPSINEYNNEELQDIFYRASVAFSHAEWEKRLYKQAHYDDLTQLPNRIMLRHEMNSALLRAEEKGLHCALMFLDLDNFKDINDTMGHIIGDQFLTIVTQRMENHLGKAGLLARIGGDEFTVLISDLPSLDGAKKRAVDVAKAVLKSFDKPFLLRDMEYFASVSIGIAFYPDNCNTGDELLKYADMSMYKAKERGKNGYVLFSNELEAIVLERNQLLQDMHLALQEEEFLIHFQPQINSINGELKGAEVLIRWQHPQRGLLAPDVFLPLAEESHLIYPIGDWVIKALCKQLQKWQKEGLELPSLSVNIAARQFYQKDLAERILNIINQAGVDPRLLEFEVTESAMIGNFKETNAILNQLKAQGSHIALDDFGTGYSSMQYLMMLPLDTMKIDRAFIEPLPGNKKNINIIRAIISLAKSLDIQIVAEGIETKDQSDLLTKEGCDIHQGFYFSEALPADAFADTYLKTKKSWS